MVIPRNRQHGFASSNTSANVRDVAISKLCGMVMLPYLFAENAATVAKVFGVGHVFKILGAVVVPASGYVVDLAAIRAWPDECLSYELVDVEMPHLVAARQSDARVSGSAKTESPESSNSRGASGTRPSYAADRTDFVPAFIANYGLPDFCGMIGLRHAWSSTGHVCSGPTGVSAPVRLASLYHICQEIQNGHIAESTQNGRTLA